MLFHLYVYHEIVPMLLAHGEWPLKLFTVNIRFSFLFMSKDPELFQCNHTHLTTLFFKSDNSNLLTINKISIIHQILKFGSIKKYLFSETDYLYNGKFIVSN